MTGYSAKDNISTSRQNETSVIDYMRRLQESAITLLARREHSQQELFQKLEKKFQHTELCQHPQSSGSDFFGGEALAQAEISDQPLLDDEITCHGFYQSPHVQYLSSKEELIQSVIDQLADDGLQSDERFTEVYVRSYVQKGQGPNKIRMNLKQLGIASHLIDEYLNHETIDWHAQIKNVFDRKFAQADLMDMKQKSKIYRFLQSRGFSSDQISRLF
ncbi:MAG: regulatory protein RecX [Cellvibrionales bacterium]|nr:regulatory protein RecX [Cellvibrionales bacterium]